MSRIALSPLHYLAIFALAVPMLGLGYIAGNGDLLSVFRLNLEMRLSGQGADYDGKIPDANQPIFPIIAEANDLFDVKGKGPRADLLYRQRVANNANYEIRRERARRAIESQIAADDTAVTTAYPSRQEVNRFKKDGKIGLGEFSMDGKRIVTAGLPIISKERVSGILSTQDKSKFAALTPMPERAQEGVIDVQVKPKYTGLVVKETASLGKGQLKFFGGLTENEFRNREKQITHFHTTSNSPPPHAPTPSNQ